MGIQSIPAVIAFVNGQPADGFMGALPESQVMAFIERLTKGKVGGEAQDLMKAAEAALAEGDAQSAAADLCAADPGGRRPTSPRSPASRAAISRSAARQGQGDARQGAGSQAQRRRGGRGPRRARGRRAGELGRPGRRAGEEGRRQPARPSGALRSRGRAQRRQQAPGGGRPADRDRRRDRKWNDDGARKQLVQFFEAWGPTDEATVAGRRRLSSILFS